MEKIISKAHSFMLKNARLLERRLFEVHFEKLAASYIGRLIRAYQNPDGGLGHGLEPDVRCSESQPLFVSQGLAALEEVGYRDLDLAYSLCDYLASVSANNGLLTIILDTAYKSPLASHWQHTSPSPDLNPTTDICGLLHFQGVSHDWLKLATESSCRLILKDPPKEAHSLLGVSRLAQYLPDRKMAMNLLDVIENNLPKASFYIANVPVKDYGLTPLHFAPKPDSICRQLFSQAQIDSHLEDLKEKQQADGGWPISWDPPGLASELEWRGRVTLDALCRLAAYGGKIK